MYPLARKGAHGLVAEFAAVGGGTEDGDGGHGGRGERLGAKEETCKVEGPWSKFQSPRSGGLIPQGKNYWRAVCYFPCRSPLAPHPYTSSTTGFVSCPIFSISIVIVSPGFRNTGGLRAKPTPCGVPVRITVPGSSVVLPLRNSISVGTSKIMSSVFQSCIISPLRIGLDFERVGIGNLVLRDQRRAERAERVERLAAAPLAAAKVLLPVAGADVVAAGVAQHVVEGVLLRGVLARLADHDGQLAFVVDLRALAASAAGRSDRPGSAPRRAPS